MYINVKIKVMELIFSIMYNYSKNLFVLIFKLKNHMNFKYLELFFDVY